MTSADIKYKVFLSLLMVSIITIMNPNMLLSQNHKLIIQNGAAFAGNGQIIVKDSIKNNQQTVITNKLILNGADQTILNEGAGSSLEIKILSVRGNGVKDVSGTIIVSDSLNVLSGANLNISDDTLRIKNLSASAGVINTNVNSVIEYVKDDGSTQSIMSGNYQGKIRLRGNSRKNLSGALTVETLEHSGWGLTINNNMTINGVAQLDSILGINNGVVVSFGADSSNINLLGGNAGIIEVVSSGKLVFINDATNGNGTIRTSDGAITFLSNVNSNGTLEVNGNGTMRFGAEVSSSNYSFSANSTVIYNGANQNIARTNYGNLQLVNAGIKMFQSGVTGIAGTITSMNDAEIDAVTNSSVIDYNGTGAQTIGAIAYYDLWITNNRGGQQVTLIPYDTIKVANSFINSATNVSYVNTNNIFEYNGSSSQTITPFTYYNLLLSNSGSKTIAASQSVDNNVIKQSSALLIVNNGVVWQINGLLITNENFINNGEIILGQ